MLNGRVRKGNGCGHPGMLTGSLEDKTVGDKPHDSPYIKMGAVEIAADLCVVPEQVALGAKKRINAAKRSTVSTGQLRRLLALHTRPINLVVFQESSSLRKRDLFLQGVSRLDAFSVYPGRT